MTLLEPRPIPDLAGLGRVHFIAVGGVGMSGIADALLARGVTVSGCDQTDSETLRAVERQGATVFVGHDPAHLADVDTVVVSTAIHDDNPELIEARRRGLPVLHRSVALASLMAGHKVVSVAGSHGKTTTTAMCVSALQRAGRDPSYVIGGMILDSATGSHLGGGPEFVVEADESDGSFRQYPTSLAVITCVDADHLDNWGTPEHYAAGFAQFATAPGVELVILDGDDPGAARLGESLTAQGHTVRTYGQSDHCDVRLSEITVDDHTCQAVLTDGSWSGKVSLAVPGVHNLHNAAAAYCVGQALGADRDLVLQGLSGFHGTARRFQHLGQAGGVTVIDDYAHHPTEIAATIAAARAVADGARLVVCFQPHLFTRTRDFADNFGQVLAQADQVVVLDVYPAREEPIPGVTGELVADAIAAHGGSMHYVPQFADAVDALAGLVQPGDIVLTIGAGSVTTVGPALLARLGQP